MVGTKQFQQRPAVYMAQMAQTIVNTAARLCGKQEIQVQTTAAFIVFLCAHARHSSRVSRSFLKIALRMPLSILDLYSSHLRSCCNIKGQAAGWKEKELQLLRKLNTTFPVITISRLKFHVHGSIFLMAVLPCEKFLKVLN